jgi:hypothetical protein
MAKKVAVVVYAGNLHFRDYQFEQDVITIGRRPDNDIFLKHASVSGLHAKIDVTLMRVTDMESSNGTLVAGEVITSALFRFGQPITIAPYHITVSERVLPAAERHSDTLPAYRVALLEGDNTEDLVGETGKPFAVTGVVGDLPDWLAVGFLALAIAVAGLLIALALWGD